VKAACEPMGGFLPGHVFRIDDVHPSMDWEAFSGYMELFARHGVVPLIGIIPDCRDPYLMRSKPRESFWDDMRGLVRSGQAEACQHGMHHVYTRMAAKWTDRLAGRFPQSEFYSLPFEKQDDLLANGRRILSGHGIFTNIFMAPSHTMDANTYRALRHNGFTHVTDGVALYPFKRGGLVHVPQQQWSPEPSSCGIITVCLHPGGAADKKILAETDAFLSVPRQILRFSEAADMDVSFIHQMANAGYWLRYAASHQVRTLLSHVKEKDDVK
jgi:predicted deacetylase